MSTPPGAGHPAAGQTGAGQTGAGQTGTGRTGTGPDLAAVQRRTVGTLVGSQALGGLGVTLAIATATLLAEDVSGSETLAGLAQTAQVLGSALASYLLGHVMGMHGRRAGLTLGYLLGSAGACLAVVAGALDSFVLLLVGTTLLGATNAANNQSRYAATDLAPVHRRARALAVVVWATTIGAVAGPNLIGPAGRLAHGLGLPPLTGPFLLGTVGILAAATVIGTRMRPDPLLLARAAEADAGTPQGTSWSRVRSTLAGEPVVVSGTVALALAHAVMVAVMVMTPLYMRNGGAALEMVGVVVSAHVLGMFGLSPVVGWATDRLGRTPVLGCGAAVLLVALALAGTSSPGASWRIGLGLFLLGLGWSLVTVAASTLLSEAAPAQARADVQGFADLVRGLTAAAAGAFAGVIVGTLGFPALNLGAVVLVLGIAVAALVARRTPC